MSVTAKLILDDRHTKKDGTQSIKLRLTVDRKSIEWSLGYSISPKYWNKTSQSVKASCTEIGNTTRFNNFLQKEKSAAIEKIISLNDNGELNTLSLKDIKKRILNNGKPQLLEMLVKSGRVSSVHRQLWIRMSAKDCSEMRI